MDAKRRDEEARRFVTFTLILLVCYLLCPLASLSGRSSYAIFGWPCNMFLCMYTKLLVDVIIVGSIA
jgi:hypothetical protein